MKRGAARLFVGRHEKQAGARNRGEGSAWDETREGLKGPLFALFALGVCMGPLGFWYLRKALVSRRWPATDGKIVDSTVSSVTRYRSRTYVVYVPTVKYTYEVDGEQFVNDTVGHGGWNSNKIAKAKAVCERYPIDDAVKVYYNPKRPATSVLERGRILLSTWIMSALGAYALAAMLVWLLGACRRTPFGAAAGPCAASLHKAGSPTRS